MSRILVVDDDPDMRALIGAYLKGAGHVVDFAEDGVAGLEAAQRQVPDLVVTDFQMPRLDGFGFFGAVRADARTAKVPVVMVTAHNNRAIMGKALRLGVDDFLGKPFEKDELLRVVGVQLKPRGQAVAAPRTAALSVAPLKPAFQGSIACCEIRSLDMLLATLTRPELDEVLAQFARDADLVVLQGRGWLLRPDDRHFLAVFDDTAGAPGLHAERALHSALALVLIAQRLKPWIASRFPGRDVADVVVAVGVHTGQIETRAPAAAGGPPAVLGGTVEIARFLAESCRPQRWSIAASRATAKSANFGFSAGRGSQLRMAAGGTVLAVEVKGPQRVDTETAEVRRNATLVEAAIDRNATLLATTAALTKKAPPPSDARAGAEAARPAPAQPEIVRGYPVVRRLAHNGVVSVYLSQPAAGGPPVVLKTVALPDDKARRANLQRWVEQYAAIGAVDHPNVARTFAQGLTATHLFIVQEYCPGGDLRNLIADRMIADDAIKALLRIASGLRAALLKGFPHGELKPSNVLIRADGTFAVADFGLAGAIEYAMGEAEAGVIVRSPEYLSPEMINGQPADGQSDVYTLGLLLHEMLTGKRAYESPDLSRVMADHLAAPVPKLPPPLEKFQPLLDKLMAKSRSDRFTTVQDVLNFMMQTKLQG